MLEKINIANILTQLRYTHSTIAESLLGLICERLAGSLLEPLSLLKATQLQAELNEWEPIPSWLFNEIGSEELMNKYLREAGADPKGSEDFILLYRDHTGEWYAYIGDLAEEVYSR